QLQVTYAPGAIAQFQWAKRMGNSWLAIQPGGADDVILTNNISSAIIFTNLGSAQNGARYQLQINTTNGSTYFSPVLSVGVESPTVFYVNKNVSRPGDGLSWSNAFANVQDALTAAGGGCTAIWVARGTYTPTNAAGAPVTLALRSSLAIYGGFAGTETDLS